MQDIRPVHFFPKAARLLKDGRIAGHAAHLVFLDQALQLSTSDQVAVHIIHLNQDKRHWDT